MVFSVTTPTKSRLIPRDYENLPLVRQFITRSIDPRSARYIEAPAAHLSHNDKPARIQMKSSVMQDIKRSLSVLNKAANNPAEVLKPRKEEWRALRLAMEQFPKQDEALWSEICSASLIELTEKSFEPATLSDDTGAIAEDMLQCLLVYYNSYRSLASPTSSDTQLFGQVFLIIPTLSRIWWDAYHGRIMDWRQSGYSVAEALMCLNRYTLAYHPSIERSGDPLALQKRPAFIELSMAGSMLEIALAYLLLVETGGELERFRSYTQMAIQTLSFIAEASGGNIRPLLRSFPQLDSDRSFVARRFTGLLETYVPLPTPNTPTFHPADALCRLTISIIDSLLDLPELSSALLSHWKLREAILSRFWGLFQRWEPPNVQLKEEGTLSVVLTVLALCNGSTAGGSKLPTGENDLFSIIAKGLTYWTRSEQLSRKVFSRWNAFVALCRKEPDTVATVIRKCDFLGILNAIRAQQGDQVERSVQIWITLGKIGGLDEGQLLVEAITQRKAAARGIVGCSWYKCPMFCQESDRLMHWCIGCKKVVYCGYFCADGDWNDGHQAYCGSRR